MGGRCPCADGCHAVIASGAPHKSGKNDRAPRRHFTMPYDPVKDVYHDAPPEEGRAPEPRAYAPLYRVTPPESVLIPITKEQVEALKRQSQNPLRARAQPPPEVPRGTVRPAEVPIGELERTTVATHYNKRREVGRDARESSPIIPLKRFNNWVKSALISMYAQVGWNAGQGARILELGCGKGGDLRKWDRHRPAVMVLIDIADVSIEQARLRYEEGHYRWAAEFFAFDCFRVRTFD